jgi:Zn-dependent protease with chaperone function
MNFFEQQDRARRNSGRLLILMVLAVLSLITLTSLALGAIWQLFGNDQNSLGLLDGSGSLLPSWPLVGSVALVVIGVVLLGSLYKQLQLSRGGQAIAERLGGRLINLSPQNFEERRLLNVVEEMALASGTSVPPVYVLDDAGINAFAAGLTPQDAVIGITRGAICQLSRDELQGVIAHEFSHVFHGDMRLNTRLVAVLHGILLLGLIGGFLLRSSGRGSRSSRDNSVAIVLAIGVTLWVLGYAGTFFGNLIKAAVSRQREFLADASAVQYTRNPESIAGALKKIGGNLYGSQLRAGHAAEFSHMYFAAGISQALEGMLATHPPLDQRIRRITPGWDGRYPHVPEISAVAPAAGASGSAAGLHELSGFAPGLSPASASEAIDAIGDPQAPHLLAARSTLAHLDAALSEAAHSCSGAQALLYGLLLDPVEAQAAQQLQLLQPRIAAEIATQLEQLREPLHQLPPGMRLPLLDLAMPALKQLAADQFAALKANLALLIRADGRVALLEWTLLRIVERNVEGVRGQTSRYQLRELAAETSVVLSLLARAGEVDEAAAQQAFSHAGSELPFRLDQLLPTSASDLSALEPALRRLSLLWPLQKPQLLKAMARCIEHDGKINAAEAELMRAVADILDCPMPPLLAAHG